MYNQLIDLHLTIAFSLFWYRTLSSSDDLQDRETEKGRLEEAFETCDRDLDELIVQHYAELTTAIRTYQSITERITSSRNKIKQVKELIKYQTKYILYSFHSWKQTALIFTSDIRAVTLNRLRPATYYVLSPCITATYILYYQYWLTCSVIRFNKLFKFNNLY